MNYWSRRIRSESFPYLESLITEDGECTSEFCYQVKQKAGDWCITAENVEKSQHTDFNEDMSNESACVACSNIWLWKLDSQKE